ncbi:class I SAM-dependent methyltransferase [Actinoplanes sp. NEAU-A12]|uniref:Class I SAM-dependent methyltransferase n=1 Tax=Actinoplanes sandaracinus TaxID=3045177 RepID=A0ABT6WUM2_9ACTN|nr:class I SAM-dependent methyltransferase [Actinoplanes sandaracinus]MDI6103341.1 class I SAM-dependent methyltransferase [Actinoplanes sandaracinus]
MNPTSTSPDHVDWENPVNAQRYAAFARDFPLYRRTSELLVRSAGVAAARDVVDLACGTGVTTRTLLAAVPPRCRVIAADKSAAMLAVAAHEVPGPRVVWVRSRAEEIDGHVAPGSVDAVVCNSAIWHTDLAATCRAVRTLLRPGGRFAFNIGARNLALVPADGVPAPGMPMVMQWACAIAAARKGAVPDRAVIDGTGPGLTVEAVGQAVRRAGFDLARAHFVEDRLSVAEQRAWMSVPIFSEALTMLRPLPYEERLEIIDEAYRRCDESAEHRTHWFVVLAVADGS